MLVRPTYLGVTDGLPLLRRSGHVRFCSVSDLVRRACAASADLVDVLWASCLPLTSLAVPLLPLRSGAVVGVPLLLRRTPLRFAVGQVFAGLDDVREADDCRRRARTVRNTRSPAEPASH